MFREQIRRIMIGVNIIEGSFDEISKNMGIKENTLVLMYALDDGKAHSQIEISRNWMMPKTTLNTIVKECVDNNIVTLEAKPHTKEKFLKLTDEGRKYAKRFLEPVYAAEERVYKEIIKDYSEEFTDAFSLFAEKLSAEMKYTPNK